jgi:hypothetical protein
MLPLRISRRDGDWVAYWATFGKTGSPANQNDQPDHENPQRECITLDRTRHLGWRLRRIRLRGMPHHGVVSSPAL